MVLTTHIWGVLALALFGTFSMAADREALLKAIEQHPDEDTPRLAYADWLDEHEPHLRARAEFIRLQVQLSQLVPGDRNYRQLKDREKALLKAHETEWLPSGFKDTVKMGQVEWTRGFAEGVRVRGPLLAQPKAREMIDRLPLLRRLTVVAWRRLEDSGKFRIFVHLPELKCLPRLTHLGIEDLGQASERELQAVGALKMPNLTSLNISGGRIAPALIERMLEAPWSRQLRALRLHTAFEDAQLRTLLSSSYLNDLQELHLATEIDDWSVLGEGDGLPNLRKLRLSINARTELASDEQLGQKAQFLRSARFARLERFDLFSWDYAREKLRERGTEFLDLIASTNHHLKDFTLWGNTAPIPLDLPAKLEAQLRANREASCSNTVAKLSEQPND